jgi:hypothetical protein
VPDINRKLTMEEKINSFLILLTKATSITQPKPPPSKIVHLEDSTQRCGPQEESNARRALHLPNAFPGDELGSSLLGEVNIV